MRTFILTLATLFALWLVGCYHTEHWKEGIMVRETDGKSFGPYTSYVVKENNQKYPRALAELGPMPGGMEVGLAVEKVVAGNTRDVNSILYGGMMMPYGLGGYGYAAGMRNAGYYNMMPTMQYPPGSFYPATMPTALPPPYRY